MSIKENSFNFISSVKASLNDNRILVAGVVILISVLLAVYFIMDTFFTFFISLEAGTAASLIASVSVLCLAVVYVIYRKYEHAENIRLIERDKKIEVYAETLKYVHSKINNENLEIAEKISQELFLYASGEVLGAFLNFEAETFSNLKANIIEDLTIAIRRDLNRTDSGLVRGKISSFAEKRLNS
jgi:Ca2+/Na+ antiporter